MNDLDRAFNAAKAGQIDALASMIEKHGPSIINSLRKPGPIEQTLLHAAVKTGQVETARFLIENGALVNAGDVTTPLYLATELWNGTPEMVALLLESGADTGLHEEKHKLSFLSSVLSNAHCGGASRDVEMLRLLLDAGAHIDGPIGTTDSSPLHVALRRGHKETVELLIKAGANVEKVNSSGHSPLGYAIAAHCGAYLFDALLDAGADPFLADRLGYSAYDRLKSQYDNNLQFKGDPDRLKLFNRLESMKAAKNAKTQTSDIKR